MTLNLTKRHDSSTDDVFANNNSNLSTTAILNEMLSDLDRSPLNASNRGATTPRSNERTKNGSFYDNGIPITPNQEQPHQRHGSLARTRIDSVEEEIEEIEIGTVNKHVKALNNVLFKKPSGDYKDRHGIPLAGFNSPEVVEERVSAFNAFLMTHNFAPCAEEGEEEESSPPISGSGKNESQPIIIVEEPQQSPIDITQVESTPPPPQDLVSDKTVPKDLMDSLDDLLEITAEPKERKQVRHHVNKSRPDNQHNINKHTTNGPTTTAQQPQQAPFFYRTIHPTVYASSSSSSSFSSKSSSMKSHKSDAESSVFGSDVDDSRKDSHAGCEDSRGDEVYNNTDSHSPDEHQKTSPDTPRGPIHYESPTTTQANPSVSNVAMIGHITHEDPLESRYLERSVQEQEPPPKPPQQQRQPPPQPKKYQPKQQPKQLDSNNNEMPSSYGDDYSTPRSIYEVPKPLNNNNNNNVYENYSKNQRNGNQGHFPTHPPHIHQGTGHPSPQHGNGKHSVNGANDDSNGNENLYGKSQLIYIFPFDLIYLFIMNIL